MKQFRASDNESFEKILDPNIFANLHADQSAVQNITYTEPVGHACELEALRARHGDYPSLPQSASSISRKSSNMAHHMQTNSPLTPGPGCSILLDVATKRSTTAFKQPDIENLIKADGLQKALREVSLEVKSILTQTSAISAPICNSSANEPDISSLICHESVAGDEKNDQPSYCMTSAAERGSEFEDPNDRSGAIPESISITKKSDTTTRSKKVSRGVSKPKLSNKERCKAYRQKVDIVHSDGE